MPQVQCTLLGGRTDRCPHQVLPVAELCSGSGMRTQSDGTLGARPPSSAPQQQSAASKPSEKTETKAVEAKQPTALAAQENDRPPTMQAKTSNTTRPQTSSPSRNDSESNATEVKPPDTHVQEADSAARPDVRIRSSSSRGIPDIERTEAE
jgi:hypothetical protein